jgi:hypothetical protein
MTPRLRRLLLISGIVITAALLAFPLRSTMIQLVVVPAAFIGWRLGLAYRTFSEIIWWWAAILVTFIILMFSLVPQFRYGAREVPKPKPKHGQVEDLAIWLGRAKGGMYFKWLIANRLGKLAYNLLLHRESGRPRSVFSPLVGEDWSPSKDLQTYLETGLHGSFSDFPNTSNRFGAQPKTPLDYEVRGAVEFLETKVANGTGSQAGNPTLADNSGSHRSQP